MLLPGNLKTPSDWNIGTGGMDTPEKKADPRLENDPDFFIDDSVSYGTQGIVQALRLKPDYSPKDVVKPSVIAIDLRTLGRNIYDRDIRVSELVKKLEEEVANLINIFNGTLAEVYDENVKVIFYVCAFRQIYADALIRPANAQMQIIEKVLSGFIATYAKKDPSDDRFKFIFPTDKTNPILYLKKHVGENFTSGSVIIASGMPLDYHLYRWYTCYVAQSYTGKLISKEDFNKAAFKFKDKDLYKFIPFNMATHALFGDRHMVRPFVTRKWKDRAIEFAKNERWQLKTETQIITSCKLKGIHPIHDFTKNK